MPILLQEWLRKKIINYFVFLKKKTTVSQKDAVVLFIAIGFLFYNLNHISVAKHFKTTLLLNC